ncbi:hypothetical protein [Acinetobacter colistiniresistens]|uniref:hypothetical protein n=1 Tax=Acinetobacter colistiniresistens TaxID=280145 RepID=UPI001250AB10|nr:hypothetical protein [Acinetobacter colistiniresistens]
MYDYKKEEIKAKKLKYLILMVVFAIASSLPISLSIQPLISLIAAVVCFILAIFFAIQYIKTVKQKL